MLRTISQVPVSLLFIFYSLACKVNKIDVDKFTLNCFFTSLRQEAAPSGPRRPGPANLHLPASASLSAGPETRARAADKSGTPGTYSPDNWRTAAGKSSGRSTRCRAPRCKRNSRERKPQSTVRQGIPAFSAVARSTSESPT